MAWQDSAFDGEGTNVGSSNSQDLFCGYGTEFNNPDRFYLDISDQIAYLGAEKTPLMSWLSNIGTEEAGNVFFSHIESENFSLRDFDAKLVRTMDGTSGVWTLQIRPQDWMAIETAAKGDTWTDDNGKPLIYATVAGVADGATTVDFSFIIQKGALYGRNYRTILAEDGLATNSLGTVQNHLVVATFDGSTITMGTSPHWTGELAESAAANLPSGVGAGNFLNTDWDGAASYDVTVHVTTPESHLKGMPQGSGLPNETRKFSRSVKGYVQITKTPFSISNTLKSIALRGGNELALRRLAKIIQHKDELERMIVFQGGGEEGVDYGIIATGDENPLTRTMGLGVGACNTAFGGSAADVGYIKTKNCDIDSTFQFDVSAVDIAYLHDWMDAIFDDVVDDPSSTKVMFCSQKWLTTFANLAGKFNSGFEFGDNTVRGSLGIPGVKRLAGPNGTLNLVKYKHFRGRYKDYGLICDFNNLKYKVLRGTKLVSNAGTDEIDGQVDYYITESGLKCMHESTHAIVKLV